VDLESANHRLTAPQQHREEGVPSCDREKNTLLVPHPDQRGCDCHDCHDPSARPPFPFCIS